MKGVRIATAVLATSLALSAFVLAQTAPAPDIALPAGDTIRGKGIFEGKGNCQSCHRVNGIGSLYGPDLSAIGAAPRVAAPAGGRGGQAAPPPPSEPTPQQLAQSILDPNAVVSVQNRYIRLTMKDGKTIWGKILSVDTFAYQIFDSTEKLANISKTDVREATMTSPMPSYRDKLTTQELSDVVSYLMSLKGQ